jgi:hypothetical protein
MSRTSLGRLGLMFVSLLGLMAVFSGPALAAGKPISTVSAATNKTLTTAQLNGTVNPNGAATTYKFEYGKTALYGKSTTVTSAGSGSTAVPVSALLSGIEPLFTYHYRISATNSFGTTVSEDKTFEMLLQWKAEGKPTSSYAVPHYTVTGPTANWTLVGEGTSGGGTAVKITCTPDASGTDWAFGTFESNYHFPYTGCKTFLNGKESKPCTDASYTALDLNAVLVPTKGGSIHLGEECSIGESFSIANGFTLSGGSPEAKEQAITLTQKSGYLTFSIVGTWAATGELTNMKFGIS